MNKDFFARPYLISLSPVWLGKPFPSRLPGHRGLQTASVGLELSLQSHQTKNLKDVVHWEAGSHATVQGREFSVKCGPLSLFIVCPAVTGSSRCTRPKHSGPQFAHTASKSHFRDPGLTISRLQRVGTLFYPVFPFLPCPHHR